MQFTGERFIPTEQGKIRLEHFHRYAVTLDIVKEKKVLDVACGEGYGASLMADVANSVTGIDIAPEAVNHANQTYQKPNLFFQQGSAVKLDFPDQSFEVVVSFETIEHLAEQEEMIAEIRRVLHPKGVLIISSPNRPVYSEESGEYNEFHIKELDFTEFDDLLKPQFPAVEYHGQRMLMGSVIQLLSNSSENYRIWNDNGNHLIRNSGQLIDPVYFVAIAAAKKSLLPTIESSITYPNKLDLVKHYVGFAKWAKKLDKTVGERDNYIISLNEEIQVRNNHIKNLDEQILNLNQTISGQKSQIANFNNEINDFKKVVSTNQLQISELNQIVKEKDKQIASLNDEVFQRGEWGLKLDAELETERERLLEESRKLQAVYETLQAVSNSNSWRLTLPLRELRLWSSTPKQQTKRYAKKLLKLVKRFYQSRFYSLEQTKKHRQFFVKYAPKLLALTETRFNGNEVSPYYQPEVEKPKSIPPKLPQEVAFFDLNVSQIDKAKTIELKTTELPLVSVIIPIYGKVGYTLNCLASIMANPPKFPFEVIVIDDCSPDLSVEILENIKDIQLIKNKTNQGFIRSCNLGAKNAKGKYLYFLNNDTQVTPNWMDELVRTFNEFPNTGLVGSKLLYPDGILQEAGGIIWQDGSAWNFGRGQDAQLPIYNYAREVDYCSGASIMIPKSVFAELGGFDEHYLPAYCEDSDLALKIRKQGYRVIYQPLSTIIHHEGISSGTNLGEGTKAYQIENTQKLFARWKDFLAVHQPSGKDVDNAKDRRAKRRILVLEHCTPTPNQDAGSVTVFNLLLLLREMDFQVTFIPEDNFLFMPEYTSALQRIGIEVLYAPFVTSVKQHLKESGERYDVVFLFRPVVAERNLETIRQFCPNAKTLYYSHDLHFLRMRREAELFQDEDKLKEAKEMKARELELINACNASILVSEQELDAVKDELPSEKLHLLPLILDIPGTNKPFSERKDIVFVGGFQHTPNIDAVKYFVSEIMPLVRQELPDVRFYVVGSKPPNEILALATDDLTVTGFVENLTPLLDKMRVSVAPLRYGAGIKGKIGTALAAGLPVVATTLAVEGMTLENEKNILIADQPEDFVKALVKVYEDEKLWNQISQNGMEFAENNWSAKSNWEIFSQIIATLGIDLSRNKYPLSLYSDCHPTEKSA